MRHALFFLVALLLSANAQTDLGVVVSMVMPSVFLVRTYDVEGKQLNIGTGFFADETGYVVTNWHVMRNASSAMVSKNGNTYRVLRLAAIDASNDLVLLQVEERMSGIPLREELPRVGESVIVVGNPLGYENTVSTGIVSAVRTNDNRVTIQITAPISPGSSGSPVIDVYGRVIGVANSTATRGQNINFVIPAREITEMIRRAGTGGISGSVRAYNGNAIKKLTVYLTNSTIKDLWDADRERLLAEGNEIALLQYNTEQMNEYTGTVSGQLLDAKGNPVSGIVSIDGIIDRTDIQGSFVISGLFPGEYVLKAEKNGVYAEEKISISPGENTFVFPVIPEIIETEASANTSYFLLKNIPPGRYNVFARGELENGSVLTGYVLDVPVRSDTESVDITLHHAKPEHIEISFEGENKVIVTLLDHYQQPVGNGYEVRLFTTYGKIVPEETFTDGEGRAFAVIYNADGATVTAVYRDPTTWSTIYDMKQNMNEGERS